MVVLAPSITSAPGLQEREIISYCGFWIDGAVSTVTWTYWCSSGTQCAIDIYNTPNIIFCPTPAFTPYTSFYDYGNWPRNGCGSREFCCPTGQTVLIKEFDNGATTDAYCAPITQSLPRTLHCYTQMGPFSVQLSLWTTQDITSQTTSNAPSGDVPTQIGPSVSSPTGTSSALLLGTESASAPSRIDGTSSSIAASTSSSPTSASKGVDGLGIGAEIGSILGAIFGAVAVLIAIYYGHRQLKEWKST